MKVDLKALGAAPSPVPAGPNPAPPPRASQAAAVAAAALQNPGNAARVANAEMEAKFKDGDLTLLKKFLEKVEPLFKENWTGQAAIISLDQLCTLPLEHVFKISFLYLAVGFFSKVKNPKKFHEQYFQLFKLFNHNEHIARLQKNELVSLIQDILKTIPNEAVEACQGSSYQQKMIDASRSLCAAYQLVVRVKIPINYQLVRGSDYEGIFAFTAELLRQFTHQSLTMSQPLKDLESRFRVAAGVILKRHNCKKGCECQGAATSQRPFWEQICRMSSDFAFYTSSRIRELRRASHASTSLSHLSQKVSSMMASCARFDTGFARQSRLFRDEMNSFIDVFQLMLFLLENPKSEGFIYGYIRQVSTAIADCFEGVVEDIQEAIKDQDKKKEWFALQNDKQTAMELTCHFCESFSYASDPDTQSRPPTKVPQFVQHIFDQHSKRFHAKFDSIVSKHLNKSSIGPLLHEQVKHDHRSIFTRWWTGILLGLVASMRPSEADVNRLNGRFLPFLQTMPLFLNDQSTEVIRKRRLALQEIMITNLFKQAPEKEGPQFNENMKQRIIMFGSGIQIIEDFQTLFRSLDIPIGVFEATKNLVRLQREAEYVDEWIGSDDDEEVEAEAEVDVANAMQEKEEKSKDCDVPFEAVSAGPKVFHNVRVYGSFSERLVALTRQRLQQQYRIPGNSTPYEFAGRRLSLQQVAPYQQLQALEDMQSILEMWKTDDPDIRSYLHYFYGIKEHSAAEQSVMPVRSFDHHRVDLQLSSFGMKPEQYYVGRNRLNTVPYRYFHNVPKAMQPRLEVPEAERKVVTAELTQRVQQLVDIHCRVHQTHKPAEASQFPNFAAMVQRAEKEDTDLPQDVKATRVLRNDLQFDGKLRHSLEVQTESLRVRYQVLSKMIVSMEDARGVDAEAMKYLKDAQLMIRFLLILPKVILAFPNPRHFAFQAKSCAFLTTYIAQHLGRYFSIISGDERRTHDLRAYYIYGLGQGIDRARLNRVNIFKGSEDTVQYCNMRNRKDIADVIRYMSNLQATSNIARQAHEGLEVELPAVDMQETFRELVKFVIDKMKLVEDLIKPM